MPFTALCLVLLAAVLHASWNIAAKRAGGDHRFQLLTTGLMVPLWAPAGLWFGLQEVPRWGALEWAVVSASAFVHWLYYGALLKGYRVGDLTVVYPLARGSGPLITALAAVLLLGESLGPLAVAGVLGVCGGVFLIAGGPALWRQLRTSGDAISPEEQEQAQALRQRTRAGVRWGLITGALIAAYSVIDGYAIKVLAMGPVIYDYMCNLLRLPLHGPQLLHALRAPGGGAALLATWRAQWRAAMVVALLGPAAYIAVLTALTMAPLSHVAPARELSLLVAALLGGKLLGERDRGLRLLGAACIAAGVMALALG